MDDTFDRINDIMYMINDQIEVCSSLYPERVSDALLKCYYELLDIEMEIEDDGEIL